MMTQTVNGLPHKWRFFRSGGFNQVSLETAADLEHLDELDQKLWSVLGCPTSGLEFDSRTLAMIDTDGDGQIRSPEILAAVRWMCSALKDPGILFSEGDEVRLDQIDEDVPDGRKLAASARKLLAYLGKPEADAIGIDDFADLTRLFVPDNFNGDGIVPPALAESTSNRLVIEKIIECFGGVMDRSGVQGVDASMVERFFAEAEAFVAWLDKPYANKEAVLPLGDDTENACKLFESVQAKVDDYFTRCLLVGFDSNAAVSLNPSEARYRALADVNVSATSASVRDLPLAKIGAEAVLPLSEGVNPAWADVIARFRDEIVRPLIGGEHDRLTHEEWTRLGGMFSAYRNWLAERPTGPVSELDPAFVRSACSDGSKDALAALITRDLESETAAESVEAVERLVRYRRDLVTLLRNFISFADFYGKKKKAIFQAGTLYLDQRSCDLCLRVFDTAKHSTLAPFSSAYLVYCTCTRKDEAPMSIVAALMGGDVDELMTTGRNGVFYDRQGRDWNATVIKVVENPVSVRQAFWTPYKRIGRMIGEQFQKFAAAQDKAVEEKSATGVTSSVAKAETAGAAAPKPAFDIAKFAGIFAAIGLAIGALGTALAAIMSGFLALPVWQMPMVIVGFAVMISGPSMLLAWFKLRQRNLGPLLDANGWAVNTRARINIPFGGSLTGIATLPKGASCSSNDPFADKGVPWKRYVFLLLVAGVLAVLWQQGRLQSLLGLPEPVVSSDTGKEAMPPESVAPEPAVPAATDGQKQQLSLS